jgi:hypothetical protein
VDEGSALVQFVETEFEETGALSVYDCHTQGWLGAEQNGEGFELEAGLNVNLRRPQPRREVKFLPQIVS